MSPEKHKRRNTDTVLSAVIHFIKDVGIGIGVVLGIMKFGGYFFATQVEFREVKTEVVVIKTEIQYIKKGVDEIKDMMKD